TTPASARRQVAPPSTDLTTPCVSPAYRVPGFRGSIASSPGSPGPRPERPFRPAPNGCQVRPPSTLRCTSFSRVDTYRVRGRRGSTTIPNTYPAGPHPANRQVLPASRVTRTPASPAAQTVPARSGSTASDQ